MSIDPVSGQEDFSVTPAWRDRKEVFRVLVLLQDLGESVEVSRARVEAQFGITHEELQGIEREGIAMSWPPLEPPPGGERNGEAERPDFS